MTYLDSFVSTSTEDMSVLTADESWLQGRGLFGGLLAGAALKAMTGHLARPTFRPRSLTMHFCAPAPAGVLAILSEVVRVGSRVAHLRGEVKAEGKVVTFFSASFAEDRNEALQYDDRVRPDVPSPGSLTPLPDSNPLLPRFLGNVEFRPFGTMPFSGAKVAELSIWARTRKASVIDAPMAAFLLDVPPAAGSARLLKPRPIASVDFRVNFLGSLPRPGAALGEYGLVTVRSGWANAGYTEEIRELWSESGKLLGQCRQLVAFL